MNQTQARQGIKNTPVGHLFVGFCVVRNHELKYSSRGEPYLVLELGDHSGRLKARIWEKPREISRIARNGSIVKIRAVVQFTYDRKELKILQIRAGANNDTINMRDLLPHSTKNTEDLKRRFFHHANSIKIPFLKQLIELLFGDDQFASAYFLAPAGKLWHHNYLSGLLEHVVTLLDLAEILHRHYPVINIDLLKTGIICHNVGKVHEYKLNGFIEFSDGGRLIGYVAMGYALIRRKMDAIENFPEELANHLGHLILSHQAWHGAQTAVPAMTLEAVSLENLIRLDSNANALHRIIENDAVPNSRWTKYIPLLDRFVYLGEKRENREG